MHPSLTLTFIVFVAGYITARFSLVSRAFEFLVLAWKSGVFGRVLQGVVLLTLLFILILVPLERIAARETRLRWDIREGAIEEKGELLVTSSGMDSSPTLMRIFWPCGLPRKENSGLLIGWRNSEYDIFVVALLNANDSKAIDHALRNGAIFTKPVGSLTKLFQMSKRTRLHVLGTLNGQQPKKFEARHIHATLTESCPYPAIYCPRETNVTVQVILFDMPSPWRMQYMSLKPISLALDEETSTVKVEEEREAQYVKPLHGQLSDKIRLHSVRKHRLTVKEESLDAIIGQINCSWEMSTLLNDNVRYRIGRSRSMSVSERVVESATNLGERAVNRLWSLVLLAYPLLIRCFVALLTVQRAANEVVLRIVEWRPKPDLAALKDVSATAQQLDIRLQQLCYWPTQYRKLRKRKGDLESANSVHPDYIRFYNSLWLVANDVIIGIALGTFLIENSTGVADWLDALLRTYTIDGLHETISWLRGKPAGLKLNKELAFFLGDLFLWVVDYWAGSMASVRPHLARLIWVIGFSSFAGATMPISIFSDLLSVLTLHIYSFYIASARIYHWQLTTIISLFHLFRGKKRNVLRNRIDSCDYDIDQLLVGTILFTLLFFLLPTVLVYYLTFAVARMIIIGIKAGLETLLACLNHFPLFALMLRTKDSKRLPGGVQFEMLDVDKLPEEGRPKECEHISYVLLKGNVSAVFPVGRTLTETLYFSKGATVPYYGSICEFNSFPIVFCVIV
ncbi:phosphatidylinositol N-acetylglucosaminyltransferase subunit gpi1 [Orbilia oligospora]|uniref:Phosphatidylinositol N-acetylglucosaminyltransferase subunit gpi1 n=1 Tax=Orbilia oligospora TaxID=2813651 RepID=A0A7C8NZM0_ORBOL|nr:phosphatidylinositol N-acetylglucosaminyltransferase subunit gpi1 [Orbilia oligospora]